MSLTKILMTSVAIALAAPQLQAQESACDIPSEERTIENCSILPWANFREGLAEMLLIVDTATTEKGVVYDTQRHQWLNVAPGNAAHVTDMRSFDEVLDHAEPGSRFYALHTHPPSEYPSVHSGSDTGGAVRDIENWPQHTIHNGVITSYGVGYCTALDPEIRQEYMEINPFKTIYETVEVPSSWKDGEIEYLDGITFPNLKPEHHADFAELFYEMLEEVLDGAYDCHYLRREHIMGS